jgi:hypothetical protein
MRRCAHRDQPVVYRPPAMPSSCKLRTDVKLRRLQSERRFRAVVRNATTRAAGTRCGAGRRVRTEKPRPQCAMSRAACPPSLSDIMTRASSRMPLRPRSNRPRSPTAGLEAARSCAQTGQRFPATATRPLPGARGHPTAGLRTTPVLLARARSRRKSEASRTRLGRTIRQRDPLPLAYHRYHLNTISTRAGGWCATGEPHPRLLSNEGYGAAGCHPRAVSNVVTMACQLAPLSSVRRKRNLRRVELSVVAQAHSRPT